MGFNSGFKGLNWSRDVLFSVPIDGDFLLRKVIERFAGNCLKRN